MYEKLKFFIIQIMIWILLSFIIVKIVFYIKYRISKVYGIYFAKVLLNKILNRFGKVGFSLKFKQMNIQYNMYADYIHYFKNQIKIFFYAIINFWDPRLMIKVYSIL